MALLFLTVIAGQIILIICRDNLLYLARRISIDFEKAESEEVKKEEVKTKEEPTTVEASVSEEEKTEIGFADTEEAVEEKVIPTVIKKSADSNTDRLIEEINRSFEYCINTLELPVPATLSQFFLPR